MNKCFLKNNYFIALTTMLIIFSIDNIGFEPMK